MDVVDPRPGAVATVSAPDDAQVAAEAVRPDAVEPDAAVEVAQPVDAAVEVAQPETAPDEVAQPDGAQPVDAAVEVAEPETAPDEVAQPDEAAVEVAEPDAADVEPTELLDAPTSRPGPPPTRTTRHRSPLRRAAAIGALTLVAALAVSAFATVGPSTGDPDQRFVDTAVSQGHTLGTGEQQALVVSAARKICDRKESHSTIADRRATALSSAELGAVTATFDADARGFTTLALQTYCSR